MYSSRNYVFPISLKMMLMHSLDMNTCQYQVFELTNQIQCIVRKSVSYVTYCADTGADRAFLLIIHVYTTECIYGKNHQEKICELYTHPAIFRECSVQCTLFHAILTFTGLVKILRMFEDGSF